LFFAAFTSIPIVNRTGICRFLNEGIRNANHTPAQLVGLPHARGNNQHQHEDGTPHLRTFAGGAASCG
jgi:hypothetical protein